MESDISVLVGHHYGISQLINAKTRMVSVLSEFQHIKGLEVAPYRAESRTTQVKIQFAAKKVRFFVMIIIKTTALNKTCVLYIQREVIFLS